MKVTTWNVNGIRARQEQVLEWLSIEQPDVLCLQEIKASPEHVPEPLQAHAAYWSYWHGHKGYSGVALLLRKEHFPDPPVFSHPAFDHENRIVAVEANGALVASIYVPNGGKDFPAKMRFLEAMAQFAFEARGKGRALILCGDFNVARTVKDVHPSLNKPEQIGQTEPERALIEQIVAEGLVDLGRKFEPDNDRLFTWWAPWRNMKEKNVGWRLDYVLASEALALKATRCEVSREFGTSDHGPVAVTFDLPLAQRKEPGPAEERPQPKGQLGLWSLRQLTRELSPTASRQLSSGPPLPPIAS